MTEMNGAPPVMATIYRKTDKGHAEIETRAHRLPPRVRQALIVVDGRRSDDDLRKLIMQQPDETLQSLLDGGFIEASGSISAPRPTPASAHAAPPAAPAAAGTMAPAAPAASTAPGTVPLDLAALKRAAVRSINDQLGPMGESLALRIERCRSPAELQPLLVTATDIIRNARGPAAATAFAARFLPAAAPP
jgi:hypothetical protein